MQTLFFYKDSKQQAGIAHTSVGAQYPLFSSCSCPPGARAPYLPAPFPRTPPPIIFPPVMGSIWANFCDLCTTFNLSICRFICFFAMIHDFFTFSEHQFSAHKFKNPFHRHFLTCMEMTQEMNIARKHTSLLKHFPLEF